MQYLQDTQVEALEACGHTACGLEKDSESPRDTVVEGEVMASADGGARGPRILVTDYC